jgi:hypothetical protein
MSLLSHLFGAAVSCSWCGLVGVVTGGKLAARFPDRALRSAFAVPVGGLAMYTFGRGMTTLLAA